MRALALLVAALSLVAVAALVALRVNFGAEPGAGDAVASTPTAATELGEVDASSAHALVTEGMAGAESLETLLGELADELPKEVADAPVRREVSERAGEVAEVATALVEEYRELGNTVVAHAGYLDLLGNVWGLAVAGPGWVDLCLVSERAEGVCELTRLRMEAEEWEQSYGGEGG